MRLQRAVPVAGIDVGVAHLHAVLARVAHQLGRLVEAHGLAVEDGGAERVRVVPLDPRRHIDQVREAGRVALGKAVLAEALDLAEAALGEFTLVAVANHAGDELLAEGVDGADVAEGGHGAAQLVGLVGREAGADDGDLHRLLLEQRHAQRLGQHRLQRRGRIVHRLAPVAPAQVGVHHVALDGAGTHDRHLDDEVVEAGRLQARQHRHLRSGLDLEHAYRVGPAQHLVDRRIIARHGSERKAAAIMALDQLEALADGREHAERQHVHLQHAERVDVVLVPLEEGAVRHGAVVDRHGLVEPRAREHEAAHVLR